MSAGPLIDKLTSILPFVPDLPMGSASIDATPVNIDTQPHLSFQDGDLTLNLRGKLALLAFNDQRDVDTDGVLLPASGAEGAPPVLTLDDQGAWLKYRTEAGLKAGAEIGVLGLQLGGAAGAVLADYRFHGRDERARRAFADDIKAGPRFALVLADVLALKPREALAFQAEGSLSASVTLSWADALRAPLAALRLPGMPGPLVVGLTAGLKVTGSISVEDTFSVAFARVDDATWRVAVKKAKSRRVAGQLAAVVGVQLLNPEQLELALDRVLGGVLGQPWDEVEKILAKASLADLTDAQRAAAGLLLERLGLGQALTALDELRRRVTQLRDDLRSKIGEIARAKIEAGFKYEYARLEERRALLQATLSGELLERHHRALVRGDLKNVVEAILDGTPRLALESFLDERSLERSRSWGFSLSLGRWVRIGGVDRETLRSVTRTNLAQTAEQRSYNGLRQYTGDWIGESRTWTVDFKADMQAFALAGVPRLAEYAYGISLAWQHSMKKLSQAGLSDFFDSLLLWRVFPPPEVEALRGRLASHLLQECELTVQLKLGNATLRRVLEVVNGHDRLSFAPALAAAMPIWDKFPVRNDSAARRSLYGPLWAAYLKGPDLTASGWRALAAAALERTAAPELANPEKAGDARTHSFSGLVELNGGTRAAVQGLLGGFKRLRDGIAGNALDNGEVVRAFKDMVGLWGQSHHLRALGVYLLDAAEAAGMDDFAERTVGVSVGGEELLIG